MLTLLIFTFHVPENMFMYVSTTNEIMVLVTLVAVDTFRKICGILQYKECFLPFRDLHYFIQVYRNTCVHIYTHIY